MATAVRRFRVARFGAIAALLESLCAGLRHAGVAGGRQPREPPGGADCEASAAPVPLGELGAVAQLAAAVARLRSVPAAIA